MVEAVNGKAKASRAENNGQEWKREKQKTEEEKIATLSEVFGGEMYAKYFIMQFEKGNCKRQLCPFALEEDIAKKIVGTPTRISENGLVALKVEVSTARQSKNNSETPSFARPLLPQTSN